MFGGLIKPPLPVLKPAPHPKIVDVVGISSVAHMAPDPRTCYDTQTLHYQQRKREMEDKYEQVGLDYIIKDKIDAKYRLHAEKAQMNTRIRNRYNATMKDYEAQIDIRRKNLNDLLAKDERELIRETIDVVQKANEARTQDRLKKMFDNRARREEERLKVVEHKTLLKNLARCEQFRPVLVNQRLRETKRVQLIQMKENEMKREADKEIDKMWHEILLREVQAKDDREEQEKLVQLRKNNEFKEFFQLQLQAEAERKRLQDIERVKEGKRLDELVVQIKKEEKEIREEKRRKLLDLIEDTRIKRADREAYVKQKEEEEAKMIETYKKLAEWELEQELKKISDKTSTEYKNMISYTKYLADLKQQQDEDEKRMDEIVKKAMKDLQDKQKNEQCQRMIKIKEQQANVMKEREKQIEYKKKRDEELKKEKETEVEAARYTFELNQRLRDEQKRLENLKKKKYFDDLTKQVEYGKLLQERENKKNQEILDNAKNEDAKYRAIVALGLTSSFDTSDAVHPFRKVIDGEKCPCPKTLY